MEVSGSMQERAWLQQSSDNEQLTDDGAAIDGRDSNGDSSSPQQKRHKPRTARRVESRIDCSRPSSIAARSRSTSDSGRRPSATTATATAASTAAAAAIAIARRRPSASELSTTLPLQTTLARPPPAQSLGARLPPPAAAPSASITDNADGGDDGDERRLTMKERLNRYKLEKNARLTAATVSEVKSDTATVRPTRPSVIPPIRPSVVSHRVSTSERPPLPPPLPSATSTTATSSVLSSTSDASTPTPSAMTVPTIPKSLAPDDEAMLLRARHLQWQFLEHQSERAFVSQRLDAERQLTAATNAIANLRSELALASAQLEALKTIDNRALKGGAWPSRRQLLDQIIDSCKSVKSEYEQLAKFVHQAAHVFPIESSSSGLSESGLVDVKQTLDAIADAIETRLKVGDGSDGDVDYERMAKKVQAFYDGLETESKLIKDIEHLIEANEHAAVQRRFNLLFQ
ncbi:hypothetical protein GQ42DRAFT_38430 [Ramicandelaber brevisporus]|nr:hypothetical protein GQ42DRAFT_38430 [Ramicandelaber brevisporus]